ncbi:MAG: DUF1735 and LamG domain-containing protein [Prevotellaceae bacterium]|jgi:hypothetical protein|nr:DUF1735 and LamG domain-containing protein [Prevotellaceae bacterium]
MKRNVFLVTLAALSGLMLAACDDAEYGIKDNSVYIAEAASTEKAAIVSMETNGADVNVTVRLAQAVDYKTQVSVVIEPALLTRYNEANSAEYLLVPDEYLQFDANAKVTIPAGEISAVFKIHVDNFDTQGKRYALPVALGKIVEGNVAKSASQSKFIYLISKPLIVSVPLMSGVNSGAVRAPAADSIPSWNLHVPQWSLEAWVRMDGYSKNNQAIFDNGEGSSEVYIRFGDANAPYNYLQVKTLGGQVQTERDLVANTWYHWTFVYDGSNFIIYRNGEQDVMFSPPPAPADGVIFNRISMIGSGATYFPNKCNMSQVRFWKTALTQAQIKNNMFFSIDPNNANLIAYWPMDEGAGNLFHDISGNERHAVASSGILREWQHNVRFDK